jgi:hypothetical protein
MNEILSSKGHIFAPFISIIPYEERLKIYRDTHNSYGQNPHQYLCMALEKSMENSGRIRTKDDLFKMAGRSDEYHPGHPRFTNAIVTLFPELIWIAPHDWKNNKTYIENGWFGRINQLGAEGERRRRALSQIIFILESNVLDKLEYGVVASLYNPSCIEALLLIESLLRREIEDQ